MTKNTSLLILFFISLVSCKTPFIEFEDDYFRTFKLNGNVEKVISYHSIYDLKDTIYHFFNKKNQIEKSIEKTKHSIDTVYYSYDNLDQLIRLEYNQYKNNTNILRKHLVIEQYYNERNNWIQIKNYENDVLKSVFEVKRCSKTQNPLTKSLKYFNNISKYNNDWEKSYHYNYKKRYVTVEDFSGKTNYHFTKKGKVFKEEYISKKTDSTKTIILKKYDKNKNLVLKEVQNEKKTNKSVYKYDYDKFKNITRIQEFLNNKLFEEYIYEYIYRK